MAADKGSDLQRLATILSEVVEKTFQGANSTLHFSNKPAIEERDIIEYQGRMRVEGMGIFNGPTYISVVNFYRSPKEQKDRKACGAVVVYLKAEYAEMFLKAAGQKNIIEDDEESALSGCGEVCKTIVDSFKEELKAAGYVELVAAPVQNHHNNVPSGVDFSFDQYKKYEIGFMVKGQRALAVDITMARIPQGR